MDNRFSQKNSGLVTLHYIYSSSSIHTAILKTDNYSSIFSLSFDVSFTIVGYIIDEQSLF